MYAIVFYLLLAGGPEVNEDPARFVDRDRFDTLEECRTAKREILAWHSTPHRWRQHGIVRYDCEALSPA